MTIFPYVLETPPLPALGLIVLQFDETVEQDFRRIFQPDFVRLHFARIPSGAEVTPDTLHDMETDLPHAAGLLPAAAGFAAIGYACTSGAMMIGPDRVSELVAQSVPTEAVTNPLTATVAGLNHLSLRRIGIVSPYVASVAEPLSAAFQTAGFDVAQTVSFGEETEEKVARIAPASIAEAARALAAQGHIDGVFLSCTNLQTLDIIDVLEAELDLPVLSSNQALAWHMSKQAGLKTIDSRFGRLFSS